MSYLLRRTRKAVWAGGTRDRQQATQEFSRREEDTDGLSVFESTNDLERQIIVAAIACERESCDRIDVMEIERGSVERYGKVDHTPEKGTTSVPAANQLHRSLNWSATTLTHMAEDLFDAGVVPKEFDRKAVREAVRKLDAPTIVGEAKKAFVLSEQARSSKSSTG